MSKRREEKNEPETDTRTTGRGICARQGHRLRFGGERQDVRHDRAPRLPHRGRRRREGSARRHLYAEGGGADARKTAHGARQSGGGDAGGRRARPPQSTAFFAAPCRYLHHARLLRPPRAHLFLCGGHRPRLPHRGGGRRGVEDLFRPRPRRDVRRGIQKRRRGVPRPALLLFPQKERQDAESARTENERRGRGYRRPRRDAQTGGHALL